MSNPEQMKFDMVDAGLKIQYVPDRQGLESCYDYGRKIGKAVSK